MMTKATWETKFGMWLMAAIAIFLLVVIVHAWQATTAEDSRWLTSCHTMGNHVCGPHEPPIKIDLRKALGR